MKASALSTQHISLRKSIRCKTEGLAFCMIYRAVMLADPVLACRG